MKLRYDAGELITAMVTPFDKKGEVDYSQAEKLANHLIENGSDAILVAGTTGESPTLTHEEEAELLAAVKRVANGRCKIIMGAGSNSTKTAVKSTQEAEKAGADAVLSVVPYYNKPSQEGMIEHFSQIAKSTSLPIILYNIPGRTGVNMNPTTVANLAGKYENIVGLKQSFGDLDVVSELKMLCPEDFAIYSGDDSLTLPMLSLGAYGVISVASHIVGKNIKNMMNSFKSGDIDKAISLHKELFPIFKKLFMAPNPVPVKAALSKLNVIDNSIVRPPLIELNEQQKVELFEVLDKYVLL